MHLVGTYQHSNDSSLLWPDLSQYSTQCLMNQEVCLVGTGTISNPV